MNNPSEGQRQSVSFECKQILDKRRLGVLCHVTSLPNNASTGDFGGARVFIDFLNDCGVGVWQVLPLGPTHRDLSPYSCTSSQAGNPLLIDLQALVRKGWLAQADTGSPEERHASLEIAYAGFVRQHNSSEEESYQRFLEKEDKWLREFSLFTAISRFFDDLPWMQWPEALRDRSPEAILGFREEHEQQVSQVLFEQFIFHEQWSQIRHYAHSKDVALFGDMPLYVAHDSVEVWSTRELFEVDSSGSAQHVAGVPPDYYSETGQKWGNPVYRWDTMAEQGFSWWVDRLGSQMALYDLLRIDHFRALQAYWEIPGHAADGREGCWRDTPGSAMLSRVKEELGALPLVAEDLGYITAEVHALRNEFGLPGMTVMQFAFDGSDDNPYLLDHHSENSVVYTGTHDNDTTMGWYNSLNDDVKHQVRHEIDRHGVSQLDASKIDNEMPWPFIELTLSSKARLAVLPLQDMLGLGEEARFNIPGSVGGNWSWQFQWPDLSPDLCKKMYQMIGKHDRLGGVESVLNL